MYLEDLAYIQAEGFGESARAMTPELFGYLRNAAVRKGTLVDLGCGAGEWLEAAHRGGYSVVGVNESEALIRRARRLLPGAALTVGSLYDFPFPACDAVTALGEVLSYLPAPAPRGLFRRVHGALRPGGVFIFDVLVSSRGPPQSYRSFSSGEDWSVLVEVSEKGGRLTRHITTFRRVGKYYRRAREVHRQRVMDRAAVVEALRGVGFTVRTSRRYGSFELLPRRLAFFARKRR